MIAGRCGNIFIRLHSQNRTGFAGATALIEQVKTTVREINIKERDGIPVTGARRGTLVRKKERASTLLLPRIDLYGTRYGMRAK